MSKWLLVIGLIACRSRPTPCVLPTAELTLTANLDDDDGDGRIDGLQDPPAPHDDEVLRLELPAQCANELRHDAPRGELRLWRLSPSGWVPLAPTADARWTLGVEVVRGRSPTWNGRASLTASGAKMALTARPVVVPRTSTLREVWVSEVVDADFDPTVKLISALEAALPGQVRRLPASVARGDRWVQDAVQAARVGSLDVALLLPRMGPTRALAELQHGAGVPKSFGLLRTGVLGDSSAAWGGNIEVLPNGKLVMGGQADPTADAVAAWFEAQGEQGPLLRLDTSWLVSNHLDDIFTVLPGAPRVLFASALEGSSLLDDAPATRSANALAQQHLDQTLMQLRRALGDDLEVVTLPVAFRSRGDGGVPLEPLWPNPVNALTVGTRVFLGTPRGPLALRVMSAIERRLRAAALEPVWLDVDAYFPRGGSVHCAVEAF